jgi:multicomponent Na+:H+ antiporter subunit G
MVGALLVGLGGLLLVVAAYGVLRLPDALARQHAATKGATLALALVCLGAMIASGEWSFVGRLLAILGFLVLTLPVASHLLARAAVREAGLDEAVRQAPNAEAKREESPEKVKQT